MAQSIDTHSLTHWANQRFAQDLFATQAAGIRIAEVQKDVVRHGGFCRCELELQPVHRNARGAVMGGVFFTLADFASAIAMNLNDVSDTEDADNAPLCWVSLDSTINFLAQPKGTRLTATAQCVRQGRTTCLYQTTIEEQGRSLATISTTGMRI